MEKDLEKKFLIVNPEDIRNIDDLEIILNSILIDFESKKKSKKETFELFLRVLIQMMKVAKNRVTFER